MKLGFVAVLAVGVWGLTLAACGGGGDSASSGSSAGGASSAAQDGPAEFGVPECDEYIAKYTACIDSKVPEATRSVVRQQLEQTKASWKQAAASPEGRAALASGCKAATAAARQAVQAYGCTW